MERVITIQGVDSRSGTSQKTGKPYTVYNLRDENNNEYAIWDNDLREIAQGSVGAQVKIIYEAKQNGRFENLTLKAIDARNAVKAPVSPSNGLTELPLAPATSPPSRGGHDAERQKAIMRQTAAKVAAHIESAHPDPAGFDLYAFLELAEKLLGYFEGGVVDEATAVPFGE